MWQPVTSPPPGNTAPGSLQPETSCMQMSVSESPVHTHFFEAAPARSNMNKTGSQRASRQRAPPVVRRVLFQLDWELRRPDWVLAKHLFISFPPLFLPSLRHRSPPSLLLSLSPSLWTEARVHLGSALLCHRKIANPGRHFDWTLKAGVS